MTARAAVERSRAAKDLTCEDLRETTAELVVLERVLTKLMARDDASRVHLKVQENVERCPSTRRGGKQHIHDEGSQYAYCVGWYP